ncbi:unnamed protein product [Caretta caretta]
MVSKSGLMTHLGFLVLLVSYSVLLAKLSTRSSEGQAKALSTCTSHLTMVTLIFGPSHIHLCPALLLLPYGQTHLCSLHGCHPVIYTLRNTDVQLAVRKLRKLHL